MVHLGGLPPPNPLSSHLVASGRNLKLALFQVLSYYWEEAWVDNEDDMPVPVARFSRDVERLTHGIPISNLFEQIQTLSLNITYSFSAALNRWEDFKAGPEFRQDFYKHNANYVHDVITLKQLITYARGFVHDVLPKANFTYEMRQMFEDYIRFAYDYPAPVLSAIFAILVEGRRLPFLPSTPFALPGKVARLPGLGDRHFYGPLTAEAAQYVWNNVVL